MNVNNTQAITAAIAALTQAVETLTVIMSELTMTETTTTETAETTEATTTETTTAETTEAASTTETTTETTTTGSLPCPPVETEIKNQITVGDLDKIADEAVAETTTTETTTTTTEAVTETTLNGVTTARKTVVATEDDLINVYDLIKYVLRHEGVNCSVDKSVYAPSKNIHVSFNNERYKMYLSLHDNELVVMLMKNDNKEETVIMKMKATLSSVEVVTVDDEIETLASNARITAVINMMSSAIDLIK